MLAVLFAPLLAAAPVRPPAPPAPPSTAVAWPEFLSRQDLVWTQTPASWDACPFIGNGNLGATVHLIPSGALAWEVNRTDVTHTGSRYPIGQLVLQAPGGFSTGTARLDLWNAEARGIMSTEEGEVTWRSFACASPSVIVVELSGLRPQEAVQLVWLSSLARPPRETRARQGFPPQDLNPPPKVETGVGAVTASQDFIGGGAFAVVQRRISSAPDRKIYVIAVERDATAALAASEANVAAERAASLGFDRLLAVHRAWWHQYYPASFVSLPDPRLEAFYWIQMYKLASAMRPDGPILDPMGPWYRSQPPSARPYLTWDGGVQLSYAPVFTANRLALGESLFANLDRHAAALSLNAPATMRPDAAAIGRTSDQSLVAPVDLRTAQSDSQRELGNLTWAMALYWQYYRCQADDAMLRRRVYPLLVKTVDQYLPYLDRQGATYHLPATYSPEEAAVKDASFDLALLRWGLETLIRASGQLKLPDPHLPRWRDVLAHLAPVPTGPGGILLGADRPLAGSLRDDAHLIGVAPLHLWAPDDPEQRKLIADSLHTWESRPTAFNGRSYARAASLHALLGEGAAALGDLETLLDRHLAPNTFYADRGPPANDAPLAAAAATQDLLLQSWGGRLRVFPAMPPAWKEAAFSTLRGEGGFLVSAVWHDGAAAWVRIESLAGGPCEVTVAGWDQAFVRLGSRPGLAAGPGPTGAPAGVFTVNLPKGGWAVLAPALRGPLARFTPVPRPVSVQDNPYPPRPSK